LYVRIFDWPLLYEPSSLFVWFCFVLTIVFFSVCCSVSLNCAVMYMCVRYIDFASYYDFFYWILKCSDSVVFFVFHFILIYCAIRGPWWSWFNGSWIYNYLCNQCLSPLYMFVSRLGEVYSIQRYIMKFVSALRQICGFFWVLRFLNQYNWPQRYNLNIVESGVKHYNPNPFFIDYLFQLKYIF